MPIITRELLRKRAEHNEGIISSLEEISLHQEELEGINEVLGSTCRKLKILYLQNNIISKMENLHHLKDLEYLNLALNNIKKIEGLQNCEFLKKLDLTVNFVDLDELEESITHLQSRHNLKDLYMMGNPAETNWSNFKSFVIAKLPQLNTLDGTEITKSMRIIATQALPSLEAELRALAAAKRIEKTAELEFKQDTAEPKKSTKKISSQSDVVVEEVGSDEEDLYEGKVEEEEDNNELTDHTPETRTAMYREIAQQKKEKAERERANAPKDRDYEKEHEETVKTLREKEEHATEKEVKQKNEGQFTFRWDEERSPGNIILEVELSRHLDSSLIDVDVHPNYVSIIIKNKLLRLTTPSEVKSGETKCQRSKTTGALVLTMPKVNPRETTIFSKTVPRSTKPTTRVGGQGRVLRDDTKKPKKLSLQEQILAEAQSALSGEAPAASSSTADPASSSGLAVDIRNIVPASRREKEGEEVPDLLELEKKQDFQQRKMQLIDELD